MNQTGPLTVKTCSFELWCCSVFLESQSTNCMKFLSLVCCGKIAVFVFCNSVYQSQWVISALVNGQSDCCKDVKMNNVCNSSHLISENKTWLVRVLNAVLLPSHIGITVYHCKDPYQPTSKMECHKLFFFLNCSHLFFSSLGCPGPTHRYDTSEVFVAFPRTKLHVAFRCLTAANKGEASC